MVLVSSFVSLNSVSRSSNQSQSNKGQTETVGFSAGLGPTDILLTEKEPQAQTRGHSAAVGSVGHLCPNWPP